VVLGHTECGAVKGAVDDAKLGNLTATLANIRTSIVKITPVEGPQTSKNKKLVQAVADQNARDAAAMLSARSEVLRELVATGQLKIVVAMHDVGTGKISWLA
jgi:carbonic anhydrase